MLQTQALSAEGRLEDAESLVNHLSESSDDIEVLQQLASLYGSHGNHAQVRKIKNILCIDLHSHQKLSFKKKGKLNYF